MESVDSIVNDEAALKKKAMEMVQLLGWVLVERKLIFNT